MITMVMTNVSLQKLVNILTIDSVTPGHITGHNAGHFVMSHPPIGIMLCIQVTYQMRGEGHIDGVIPLTARWVPDLMVTWFTFFSHIKLDEQNCMKR